MTSITADNVLGASLTKYLEKLEEIRSSKYRILLSVEEMECFHNKVLFPKKINLVSVEFAQLRSIVSRSFLSKSSDIQPFCSFLITVGFERTFLVIIIQ